MSAEARRCSTEGMISACKVFLYKKKECKWNNRMQEIIYDPQKMRYLWLMVYCMK
jgi:hypothetical protein